MHDKNTVSKVVSEMFEEAGVSERRTNLSLRAAGVSQLFEAEVNEKIIQKNSGHMSLDALRCYERITPAQDMTVSNILASKTDVTLNQLSIAGSSSGINCYGCTVHV